VNESVLVVEDEPAIRDAISFSLRQEGYDVAEEEDGDLALARALREDFDLVLLDLMLPGLSGMEVCRRLRAERDVPILILTARGEEVDRVLGLESGADDYVVKPFSMPELLGRVRAILRRRDLDRNGAPAVLRAGALEVDLHRHEARLDGSTIRLTASEFRLLAALAREPGRTLTRDELVRELWGSEYVGDRRACDTHVVSLRRKLGDDGGDPTRLVSVRGVGYRLLAV
jgi:two-component system, OmpR family, response regulator RegX3